MINNVQILRAFSALNVVLFHTFGQTAKYGGEGSALARFFGNWGNCGVDIFFVISGFIMILTQYQHPTSTVEFIKDRAKKIVPLYWSISLLFILLLIFVPSAFNQAVFSWKHALTSLLFTSRPFGYDFPILDQGWTLEYEMLFYVLFGLSLSIKRVRPLVIVPLVLVCGTMLTNLNLIVMEFVFGMAVGMIYTKGWLKQYGLPLFATGTIAILASLFFEIDMPRVVRFGIPAFFIVLGSCYLPQIQCKPLILIGSASYSIYITQALTLPAFYKAIKFAKVPINAVGPDLITASCVVVATLVGILVYQCYEKPVARILK